MARKSKTDLSLSKADAETIVTGPESSDNLEVTMSENTFNNNDGVTELDITQAVPGGRVGDPKSVSVRSLDILGSTIEVESFDTGAVRFGTTQGIKEYVTLRHFGEVLGFLNGIKYVLDGKYPQLKRGFHAKFAEGDFDYVALKDAAYVNFDALNDIDTVKMLLAHGIERKQGGILVLGIKNYKLYRQYHVNAMEWPELKRAAAVAKLTRVATDNKDQATLDLIEKYNEGAIDISLLDLPVMSNEDMQVWNDNNEKAWNQINLHKGLDLIIDIVAGKRAVLVAFKPFMNLSEERKNFQYSVIGNKISLVFGTREERTADTARGIQAAADRRFIRKGAFMVRENVKGMGDAAAKAVADGIRVFVNGNETNVPVEQLLKSKVRYAEGGEFTRHMPYLNSPDAVKAAVAFARAKGWDIHVVASK